LINNQSDIKIANRFNDRRTRRRRKSIATMLLGATHLLFDYYSDGKSTNVIE